MDEIENRVVSLNGHRKFGAFDVTGKYGDVPNFSGYQNVRCKKYKMRNKKINFEALLSALVFFCTGALFIFTKGFYHSVYDIYIELPASPVREILGIISVLLGTYVLLKFTKKRTTETEANSVSELENKKNSESNEQLEEPSLESSPFAKKDWGFVAFSVLKIPIILAFVFGGIYLVLFGAIFLIKHLTN